MPAVSTAVFDGHPLGVAFDEIVALGLRHVVCPLKSGPP